MLLSVIVDLVSCNVSTTIDLLAMLKGPQPRRRPSATADSCRNAVFTCYKMRGRWQPGVRPEISVHLCGQLLFYYRPSLLNQPAVNRHPVTTSDSSFSILLCSVKWFRRFDESNSVYSLRALKRNN